MTLKQYLIALPILILLCGSTVFIINKKDLISAESNCVYLNNTVRCLSNPPPASCNSLVGFDFQKCLDAMQFTLIKIYGKKLPECIAFWDYASGGHSETECLDTNLYASCFKHQDIKNIVFSSYFYNTSMYSPQFLGCAGMTWSSS